MSAPSRRRFLRNGLTLGGIAMLTGCDLSDNANVEQALSRISRFNDRYRAGCSMAIARAGLPGIDDHPAVPVQRFYAEEDAPDINGDDYRLEWPDGCRTNAPEPAAAAPDGAGQP